MRRERKPFRRTSGVRDAKLIIIAAEGELTEKGYFLGIAFSSKYKNSKVHVEFIDRGNSNSDPRACMSNLNKFKKRYNLGIDDELWLVCDVDRWGQSKLSEVNRLCKQKSYLLAVSNPCFETWLLLHFIKVRDFSSKELSRLTAGGCNVIIDELKARGISHNKSKLQIDNYIDHVDHAIQQAMILDPDNLDWPNEFGSHVYRLMNSMINGR